MATTTAVLLVSPRRIGPWGDDAWKVTHVARLLENSIPAWSLSELNPAPHEQAVDHPLPVVLPCQQRPLSLALCVLIGAIVLHDPAALAAFGLPDDPDEVRRRMNTAGRRVELAKKVDAKTLKSVMAELTQSCRIGVVRLERGSGFDETEVRWITERGLDVSVYEQA
jgi:hypothetical protein